MAYKTKRIHNRLTGQSIEFIKTAKDTHGALLEMISTFRPHSTEPKAHYHPIQEEDFIVLEGELTVRINRKTSVLKAGDKLHLAPEVIHAMWNNSSKPARVNWQVRPALDTEYLLETFTGMANEIAARKRERTSVLLTAQLMHRFSMVYRLAAIPFIFQKVLFVPLSWISLVWGNQVPYHRYID